MPKTKTYKSDALAAIHEIASDYHAAGVIDKQTMDDFDESCLTPIHEYSPQEIQALREREQVSQTVFAYYLNVSKESVSQVPLLTLSGELTIFITSFLT
ncbi:MAG: transcriptional regulator [Rhizonema sp. NSF051]|nr:transcriptional regulator [Rhizonema sp. NSF051]